MGMKLVEDGLSKLMKVLNEEPNTPLDMQELEKIHGIMADVCILKAQDLYKKYDEACTNYIKTMVFRPLKVKSDQSLLRSDQCLLRELAREWKKYKDVVMQLSLFFKPLDNHIIHVASPKPELRPLKECAFEIFQSEVYYVEDTTCKRIRNSVISVIDEEREGGPIDEDSVKSVLDILWQISCPVLGPLYWYEKEFEELFLVHSFNYYNEKAKKWSAEYSCSEYMLMAEECLQKERDRVSRYLHLSTEQKLVKEVEESFMASDVVSQLLDKACSEFLTLLREEKVGDLSRMYRFFHRNPKSLSPIALTFKQYIATEGKSLFQKTEEACSNKAPDSVGLELQTLLRKVTQLHDKYMSFVNDCFENHTLFLKALREAFEVLCNQGVAGKSSAEWLATFLSDTIKMGQNGELSDEDLEETLAKVMKLLALLTDKVLFGEIYRRKLSRRLLNDRRANEDLETSVLSKLTYQYGGLFTRKMDGMVKDLTLARDHQANFEEYLRSHPTINPGIDLNVTLLTSRFWPINKFSCLNLPTEMVNCLEAYEKFYQANEEKKKLTWLPLWGSCHIDVQFDAKVIELVVSTDQAAVLLLFNKSDRFNQNEIMTELNLNNKQVDRLLRSLSHKNYKILSRIRHTNYFEVNSKFSTNLCSIKIPPPPLVGERKKLRKVIERDRKSYEIDCCVIRIMKNRQVLAFTELMSLCEQQLGYKLSVRQIKMRIEDLIVRDYLKRSGENLDTLEYLPG